MHKLILAKVAKNVNFRAYFSEPVDTSIYIEYFDYVFVGSDVGTIAERYHKIFINSKTHPLPL